MFLLGALLFSEIWYSPRVPDVAQVQRWNQGALNGGNALKVTLNIHAGDPTAFELETLTQLRGYKKIHVTVGEFPAYGTEGVWRSLARVGVVPVFVTCLPPTEMTARQIASMEFREIIWVCNYYPGPAAGKVLEVIPAQHRVIYAAKGLPRHVDIPGLTSVPADSEIEIVADYFPTNAYHRAVLKRITQKWSLRVTGAYPQAETLALLPEFESLQNFHIENPDSCGTCTFWSQIPARVTKQWTSRERVPSSQELQAFGSGRLVIDQNEELTTGERERLNREGLEWIWLHNVD